MILVLKRPKNGDEIIKTGESLLIYDKADSSKAWRKYMELRKYIHRMDGY
ncbi:hypothetical protein BROSI_A2976 [Candidatus Brocadia sinica JPN1]|uniref:Uncharacterized protein n=1 Tax=Candidatus Brocadia sinica JPN1 TaxID=1197129 RepID=A0ABQ0K143_9BACT|nr:hypothetical protein BROSI_A2976 [Candidatus Brocadia sinica JPN1]